MLIKALCDYAEVQDNTFPEGWCEQDVHYGIVLSSEGELLEFIDLKVSRTNEKGKTISRPSKAILPARSQKPGIESNYIEHRPLYIFGLNYDKETDSFTPDDKTDKARKSHKAFVEHELEFTEGLDSEICTAYRKFIENWVPENETENAVLKKIGKDIGSSYFTFTLGVGRERLEEDEQLKNRYNGLCAAKNAKLNEKDSSVCGILGKRLPQARLHDKIKFPGGQSSGCQLVCMNDTAFESYGKTQSFNSNVSEEAMKKYTAAFNKLLADKRHYITLDDMTVIFFAIKDNDEAECDLFSMFARDSGKPSADRTKEQELKTVLEYARDGFTVSEEALKRIDKNTTFYIAGLTPNSSRICQKFICKNKFGDIISNLIKHQNDLKIRAGSSRPVYFWGIKNELVSPKAKGAKVSPALMTNIMLAAFNGTRYPDELLATVVRRVKTDSDEEKNRFIKLNDTRAGIIKACINRKYNKEDITMSWNDKNENQAYICGGLFAVYEKIQQDASGGGLNRTIKDAYYSSACSRPASVFPTLEKLSANHLRKLSEGSVVYYKKLLQSLMNGINGEFPSTLSLDDQGRFIVGYYQMNDKLYTSTKD
ncbi:MAG: type I-C CRISPR-associated protein Cas8c/Csd1 [Ruminiclostridium sp.]